MREVPERLLGRQAEALLAQGETELPLMSKRELAERIWDRVERLRGPREAVTAAPGPKRVRK